MPTIMDGGKSIGMGHTSQDTSIPIAHVERGAVILWSFTYEKFWATGKQPDKPRWDDWMTIVGRINVEGELCTVVVTQFSIVEIYRRTMHLKVYNYKRMENIVY